MRLVGALPQPNYEDTYEDPHQHIVLSSTPPTSAGSSFNTSGGGGLVLVSMRLL